MTLKNPRNTKKQEIKKHKQYGYGIPLHSIMRTKLSNVLELVNMKDNDGNSLKYTDFFCHKKVVNYLVSF